MLVVLISSCVTLEKALDLSLFQYLNLKNGLNNGEKNACKMEHIVSMINASNYNFRTFILF